MCRSCFKDVGKLYKLQLEISNFKETVATKVSEGIHQFAVVYSSSTYGNSPSTSQGSKLTRKRSAADVFSQPDDRKKQRKIQDIHCIPNNSNKSPDVTVSIYSYFPKYGII